MLIQLMRQGLLLPEPSRNSLDDGLILIRLAMLYAVLALLAHHLSIELAQLSGLRIDHQVVLLHILYALISIVSSLGVAWLLVSQHALRWQWGNAPSSLALFCATLVAVTLACVALPLADLVEHYWPAKLVYQQPPDYSPEFDLLTGSTLERMLAFLSVALLVPLAEELIFRGWLFKALMLTRGGLWLALPLSTGLFVQTHNFASPGPVLIISLLGLALGWLRWKFGSLWPCLLAHSLYNALILWQML
ncbi:MAG: hypothetical protein CVV16_01360 [Gammaproteobacteria bacterium HGW-Gammaproteobacteria-6]|nr:MAG: hypothetical protein CVV16_01360 [Gammaproteobacteria bacterium HGW-Gammaproteobacteria-6]